MLSPSQQRGRLRALVVRELKSFDIKYTLKSLLKSNNQYASGFLTRSISATRYGKMVTVRSSIDSQTGILDNVTVSIQIPWGRYGIKLDEEFGSSEYAVGQMTPDLNVIYQWVVSKGIDAKSYVKSTLKNGTSKTYSYTGVTGRKIMAYHIQQNIIKENELRTRNDYAGEIRFEFESILNNAINDWVSEMAEEQMVDVYVELNEIY